MKIALGVAAVVGLLLVWFGYRIINGPGSADSRIGGAVPVMLGIVVLSVDAVAAIIYAVVT